MSEEVKVVPTLSDVFDETAITGTPVVSPVSTDTGYSTERKPNKRRRKKIDLNLKCPLCESGIKYVTYKDIYQLKKFTSVRGKIISTEKSGVCSKHQRQLTGSIKRARFMALMPYVAMD